MSLAVVFDEYSYPKKGDNIEIEIKRSFSVNISAQEAKQLVNHWLLMDVSTMIGTQEPTLAISREGVVWRVPAVFTAPQAGIVGEVGRIDVNVQTGEMNNTLESKFKIEQAAEALAANLPPLRLMPVGVIPPECILDDVSDIPILEWPDDEEYNHVEAMESDSVTISVNERLEPHTATIG